MLRGEEKIRHWYSQILSQCAHCAQASIIYGGVNDSIIVKLIGARHL